jgi:hypothetical protein
VSGPTGRGPRYVRVTLREHLQAVLPPLVPYLQGEWADPAAFPPAGPEADADTVPRDDRIQTSMGRPIDKWPLVQVEVQRATVRRSAIETTDGSDSMLYYVTYQAAAFVWVDVAPPESLPVEEEREYVTDVRDDLAMALRYALLDTPAIGVDDSPLLVLPNSYAEDYGEPQPAGGQRWTVGGRAQFGVRAQERLTRPSLATVSADRPDLDFEITVHPVPVDHPALL